jgi:predicted translin family RNA/ssDNA-binding protein
MDKELSPPTKPPRISVPVSDEVLQVFQRLAKAGNMSTGRAIAEWLSDTVEAAEYMAATMERARAAPKVVMREMHAYAQGLADETGELMRTLAEKGKAERAKASDTLARKRSAGERGGGLSEAAPPAL